MIAIAEVDERAMARANHLTTVRERALRAAIRQRPDLAIEVTTLLLGWQGMLRVSSEAIVCSEGENDLAAMLENRPFAQAAEEIAKAPRGDTLVTFAHLVAQTIVLVDKNDEWIDAMFALCRARGAAVKRHLLRYFDAPSWLSLCTPAECSTIAAEIATPVAENLSPDSTAFILGRLCRMHEWLPPELRRHTIEEQPSEPFAEGIRP